MKQRLLTLAPALALLGACAAPDGQSSVTAPERPLLGAAGGTSTAQSIMVSLDPMGPFVIQGTEIYEFNHAAAEAYFTNTVTSGPTISCGGNATNCATANQPATPSAPAPDAQKVVPVASSNSCTFFAGGALSVNPPLATYTLSVTKQGLNTKGNWTYTWTYTVATTATVAEKTAWDLQSATVIYPEATVSGFVAGQSTQARTSGNWSLKASHTISDPASLNGTRVSGLTLTVTAPDLSTATYPLGVSLGSGDFVYSSLPANRFGPTSQLFEGAYVSAIQNGTAPSLGNAFDDFAGNNGLVAETAVITPQSFSLASAGNWGIAISGNVKGNDGTVSQSFNVGSSISVQAGSCTPTP